MFSCKQEQISGSNITKKMFWWNYFRNNHKDKKQMFRGLFCNHFGQDSNQRYFRASKIVLAKARLLKHNLHFHSLGFFSQELRETQQLKPYGTVRGTMQLKAFLIIKGFRFLLRGDPFPLPVHWLLFGGGIRSLY